MFIDVDNLNDLADRYPELKPVVAVSDKYGEANDVTVLCEAIAKLAARIDKASAPAPSAPTGD